MAAAVGLDGGLLDSVANSNFKTIAEGPIIDAQGHRNRMNGIFEAASANSIGTLTGQNQNLPQATASNIEQGGVLANTMTQLSAAQAQSTQALVQALAVAVQALAAANAGGSVPAKA